MKKILITTFIIMMCGQLFAQTNDSIQQRIDSLENTIKELSANIKNTEKQKKDKSVWGRKKFLSIGYVNQKLSPKYGNNIEGDFGISLISARTIFLHKKPLWKVLKFGIDYGFDINYVKYKDYEEEYNNYYDDEDTPEFISGMHQCDLGFLIGANATVNPVGDLRVSAYFRFIPTYSMLIFDGDINSSYVSFFTYGGEIAWKTIGIGVEGRFGSGKYGSIISDYEYDDNIKETFKTTSLRAYICLHF